MTKCPKYSLGTQCSYRQHSGENQDSGIKSNVVDGTICATMLKLLIVDAHTVFREGLKTLLEMEGDFSGVETAGKGDEALTIVSKEQPDVILLEPNLTDSSGADLCRLLLQASPESKVLILSSHSDEESVSSALVAGARGYVLKTTSSENLVKSIRSVSRGEVVLAASVAATVVEQLGRLQEGVARQENALRALTPREREVFFLASRGLTYTEIAGQLYLTKGTVKTHLHNIYEKLNLSGKAELGVFAVKMGLSDS